MYEKEGEAFLPKYRALLKASTTHTVEETAAIAGIDWRMPLSGKPHLNPSQGKWMNF